MREDLPSLWNLFAEKLSRDAGSLRMARETCARWLREGHSGAERIREWDRLLAEAQAGADGMARLVSVLRGTDESAGRLREFHPLAGILTREERRQARELCGYRH